MRSAVRCEANTSEMNLPQSPEHRFKSQCKTLLEDTFPSGAPAPSKPSSSAGRRPARGSIIPGLGVAICTWLFEYIYGVCLAFLKITQAAFPEITQAAFLKIKHTLLDALPLRSDLEKAGFSESN
jgi:hypothetical protein